MSKYLVLAAFSTVTLLPAVSIAQEDPLPKFPRRSTKSVPVPKRAPAPSDNGRGAKTKLRTTETRRDKPRVDRRVKKREATAEESTSGSTETARARTLGSADGSYTLGPRDRLNVQIWNQAEIEFDWRPITVNGSGRVFVPLLDDVGAAGLTIVELTEVLARLYDDFIINPQVYLEMVEYNSRQVSIVGAVRAPGRYALKGDLTLTEVLAEAGDLSPLASDNLRVIRKTADDAEPEVIDLSIAKINSGDPRHNLRIRPNDTIMVLPNPQISIIGEISAPGRYPLREGSRLMEVLADAGDLNENASDIVRVIRQVSTNLDEPPEVHDISISKINSGDPTENIMILPEDHIYVLTNKNIVYVTGMVRTEGYVDWEEGMTAIEAVILAGGVAEGNAQGRTKIFRDEGQGTVEMKVNLKKRKQRFLVEPGDIIHVPKSWL